MKRNRGEAEIEKKQKSPVEVEPEPSAAVPCHISAEHDSRAVRCGNDLGFSPQIQTRRVSCRPGGWRAACDRGKPPVVFSAPRETGSNPELTGVHPRRAQTGQPAVTRRTNCS